MFVYILMLDKLLDEIKDTIDLDKFVDVKILVETDNFFSQIILGEQLAV